MARLPQVGGDDNDWGTLLNDFLSQSHDSDGKIKAGAVTAASISDGALTEAKLNTAVINKLNSKTALSVDGTFVPTYDLDTTPLTPADIGAYTSTETDAAIAAAVTPNWQPVSVAPETTQNFLTTTYALITGLTVDITVTSTADIFLVSASLDVAAYAPNANSVFVAVLNVTTAATGADTSFPIRFPTANFRFPVAVTWTISGMAAGTRSVRLAGYLTEAGNYQVGTGSTLSARRIL